MPEADWWLCDACQSLNNLSARRCYSCHRRKPRRSQRASQYLGYVPVITWDKRVRYNDPPSVVKAIEEQHLEVKRRPPPLREPVSRSITDVAPPVPWGVRMTYRAIEPPVVPRIPPGPAPDSPLSRVVGGPAAPYPPAGPPPRLVAIPVGAPPPPQGAQRSPVAIPVGAPPPPQGAQRPLMAIPVGPDMPPGDADPGATSVTAGWAHWRDLLDVPTAPDADRLRRALASPAHRRRGGESGQPLADTGSVSSGRDARAGVAEADDALDWPAEDLTAKP